LIPANPKRNRLLYNCYQQGLIIEEAANITNIPLSTVGYYYLKFNRRAMAGKRIPETQIDSEKALEEIESQKTQFKEDQRVSQAVGELEKQLKYNEASALLDLYKKKKLAGLLPNQLAARDSELRENTILALDRRMLDIMLGQVEWNQKDIIGSFVKIGSVPKELLDLLDRLSRIGVPHTDAHYRYWNDKEFGIIYKSPK
jgi:hypothetical protein